MVGLHNNKAEELKEKQNLSFEEALLLLKAGEKLFRTGWKNVLFVAMQTPDENSKMKKSYLYCVPLDQQAVPWVVSNADLFTQDWSVYKA